MLLFPLGQHTWGGGACALKEMVARSKKLYRVLKLHNTRVNIFQLAILYDIVLAVLRPNHSNTTLFTIQLETLGANDDRKTNGSSSSTLKRTNKVS